MSALDQRTADRLSKLCGMFGSDHEAERATAAALADKLIRDRGLTWQDILLQECPGPLDPPETVKEQIRYATENLDLLNLWEIGFLNSIEGRHSLSIRQRQVLNEIIRKIRGVS
jgi:hypothetical protein